MSTRRYIMREQIKKILELYEQGLSLGEICETIIIRNVVEKYDGDLKYTLNEGVFRVEVIV